MSLLHMSSSRPNIFSTLLVNSGPLLDLSKTIAKITSFVRNPNQQSLESFTYQFYRFNRGIILVIRP